MGHHQHQRATKAKEAANGARGGPVPSLAESDSKCESASVDPVIRPPGVGNCVLPLVEGVENRHEPVTPESVPRDEVEVEDSESGHFGERARKHATKAFKDARVGVF